MTLRGAAKTHTEKIPQIHPTTFSRNPPRDKIVCSSFPRTNNIVIATITPKNTTLNSAINLAVYTCMQLFCQILINPFNFFTIILLPLIFLVAPRQLLRKINVCRIIFIQNYIHLKIIKKFNIMKICNDKNKIRSHMTFFSHIIATTCKIP